MRTGCCESGVQDVHRVFAAQPRIWDRRMSCQVVTQSQANSRVSSFTGCKDRPKRHDMEWSVDGQFSMIVHDGFVL